MTIINPNSIAGITSVTAQAGVMNFYKSDGTLAGLQLDGVNFNTTTGISTFNNLVVGGTLTYEDVKNVDSVGIITARAGIFVDDSITHIGDTNTKIRFPTNDTITFETSGAENVRIASTGDFTVKTGSQYRGYKLHKADGGTVAELVGFHSDNDKGGLTLWETGTKKVQILAHGSSYFTHSVGIGTVAPAEELHLQGNTAVVALIESTGANDSRVRIKAPSDRISYLEFADNDADAGEIRYDHSSNYMGFHVNNNVERLRITSAGEVKIADGGFLTINTNAASSYGVSEALRIDDGGGVNDRALQIFEYQHSGARSHRIQFNTNTTTNGSAYTHTQGNYGGSSAIDFHNLGDLIFYTDSQATSGSTDSITPSERVRITAAGELQLNTGAKLSNNSSGNSLKIENSNGYVTFGPQNTSYCHLYTDRGRFYFNKKLIVDEGIISAYSEHDLVLTTGSSPGATSTGLCVQNSTNYVGIGTNVPSTALHIVDEERAQGEDYATLSLGSPSQPLRRVEIGARRSTRGGDWDNLGIGFKVHQSNNHTEPPVTKMVLDYDGYLGIGSESPKAKLDVWGNIYFNNSMLVSSWDTNGPSSTNIDHIWHDDASTSGTGGTWNFVSDAAAKATGNSCIQIGFLKSSGGGSFGGNLDVNGSFAATTKSFIIDHPTKEGMKLRYGSLEGPENGVYVRGRLKDNNTIELPDYWTGLVDEDTITVNLTSIGSESTLHKVVDIYHNTVVIGSEDGNINCFYTVFGERKDVEKMEVEY